MELEHTAHGIDFGSGFGQRLDWLDESTAAMRALLDGEAVTSAPGGHYAFDGLRQPPAAGPAPPADHDRRLRREEDAPDGRPLRRPVERDGPARRDAPQDRGPPPPLRGRRSRPVRDRVHARHQGDDPRQRGRGGPGLEGGDGAQPDADGRRRGRRHVLERHRRPAGREARAVRRARVPDRHQRAAGAVRRRDVRAAHRRGRRRRSPRSPAERRPWRSSSAVPAAASWRSSTRAVDADATIAAIEPLGVEPDRIEVFTGDDGAAAFDGSGRSHGIFGRLTGRSSSRSSTRRRTSRTTRRPRGRAGSSSRSSRTASRRCARSSR